MNARREREAESARAGVAALPRGVWHVILWAALIPPSLAAILAVLNVPLGCPGRFTYLYSPVPGYRSIAALGALALAGALGFGVWLVASDQPRRRTLGWAFTLAAGVLLVGWTYISPPEYRNQQLFNSQSPSQDGAFVRESKWVTSVGAYLARFPGRAATPPAEMRGTRVVSNPPGTTLLAYGVRRAVAAWPALGRWVSDPLGPRITSTPIFSEMQPDIEAGLLFQITLMILWAAAGAALYAAGRVVLPPPAAVTFAALCLFSPSGLLFSPGKDTAQLLTVGLALWLWLFAWRRESTVAAVAAGLVFVFATLVSLVHIWLAAIVVAATLSQAARERRPGAVLVRRLLPALAGMLIAIVVLWMIGCDWLATLRAAAAAQAEITRGPDAMPLYWQVLGAPLFLLFGGAGLYAVAYLAARSTPADGLRRFGVVLVAGSVIVMLATVGFTNIETPRLWIPFVPLILLGLMVCVPALAERGSRVALFLGVLVFAHVASSAALWTRMDMREAENRISSGEFFG